MPRLCAWNTWHSSCGTIVHHSTPRVIRLPPQLGGDTDTLPIECTGPHRRLNGRAIELTRRLKGYCRSREIIIQRLALHASEVRMATATERWCCLTRRQLKISNSFHIHGKNKSFYIHRVPPLAPKNWKHNYSNSTALAGFQTRSSMKVIFYWFFLIIPAWMSVKKQIQISIWSYQQSEKLWTKLLYKVSVTAVHLGYYFVC